jgi:hypothetical protein
MAALDKPDWESDLSTEDRNKETAGEYYGVRLEDQSPAVTELYAKINALTDKVNTHINSIATNTAKTGITTAQANAITANTAKTSMTLGTTGSTALAGDTRIAAFTADDTSIKDTTKSTAITFGNFTTTGVGKTATYTLPITVTETTVVVGAKGSTTTTLTKTGSITLA